MGDDGNEDIKISSNLDKYTNLFSKIGFPTGVAVWALYEFHSFGRQLVENQVLVLDALRQLIALHK